MNTFASLQAGAFRGHREPTALDAWLSSAQCTLPVGPLLRFNKVVKMSDALDKCFVLVFVAIVFFGAGWLGRRLGRWLANDDRDR